MYDGINDDVCGCAKKLVSCAGVFVVCVVYRFCVGFRNVLLVSRVVGVNVDDVCMMV